MRSLIAWARHLQKVKIKCHHLEQWPPLLPYSRWLHRQGGMKGERKGAMWGHSLRFLTPTVDCIWHLRDLSILFFSLVASVYTCLCGCLCIYANANVYVCACIWSPEFNVGSSLITLPIIFLLFRTSLTSNLELTNLTRLAGQQGSEILLSPSLPSLGLQRHATTPGCFTCILRVELGSSIDWAFFLAHRSLKAKANTNTELWIWTGLGSSLPCDVNHSPFFLFNLTPFHIDMEKRA